MLTCDFLSGQKRVNTASLRLLLFRKTCFARLACGWILELDTTQRVPCSDRKLSLNDKGGPLCLDGENNLVYAEYLFPSEVWNFGSSRQKASMRPTPNKNLRYLNV